MNEPGSTTAVQRLDVAMAYSMLTDQSENSRCSFAGKGKKQCGYSSLSKKNEYLKLKFCNANITKHLAGCHLNKSLREYEIILARAGIFRWEESCLEEMVICSSHRVEFGKYWRGAKSCQYPGHKGKAMKIKDRHVINVDLASKIMDVFECVVPIGSPICSTCREDAGKLDETEENNYTSNISTTELSPDLSRLSIGTQFPQSCPRDPNWTPVLFSTVSSTCSQEDLTDTDENLTIFNDSMSKLSKMSGTGSTTLTFQLNCEWDEASLEDKNTYITKAKEACKIVCDAIAPNDGDNLFNAMVTQSNDEHISGDLIALMTAFADAPTRRLKIQILSLYAHRFPIRTLAKLHEPYGKVSHWLIRQARIHASQNGPGAPCEVKTSHRVRIDQGKLDHFIDFINRPYFYQDVAFGTRVLTLNTGEKLEMPNVVRTVARSTMVTKYLKYCVEEGFSPLSRSTMFRILDVREASQRTSLRGLDNIATDGAIAFQKLEAIVQELDRLGAEKTWVTDTLKMLHDSKIYLKVEYPVHCALEEGSLCKDHCRKYALSDPVDKDLQEICPHEHIMKCDDCEQLKFVIKDIEEKIESQCKHSSNSEQQQDMLYDLKQASNDIHAWKAHIMRLTNQDKAKQDILKDLNEQTVLIVMDWAMKFQPCKFREKQSEWFGKRGLNWHVSSVISAKDGKLQVKSYAHLIDTCTQDWFSVISILQNLLHTIHTENPSICKAFIRSDEAGCYHNNMLIAACNDISKTTGVKVIAYHFSEPQNGKDICDRIISPLKSAIKTYCNEGNDILSSRDMYTALRERPVRGVTACVSVVDESKNTLHVEKIEGFQKCHNFKYERAHLRVWRAYGIGQGKLIPLKSIYKSHLSDLSLLEVSNDQKCFSDVQHRELDRKKDSTSEEESEVHVFECTEPGCAKSFDSFADLELHLDAGTHEISSTQHKESLNDGIKRKWAHQFTSISNIKMKHKPELLLFGDATELETGWALSKAPTNTRFSEKVKSYLKAKFTIGERTGNKAIPKDVAADMRKARNESGDRVFTREEWLKESQVKSFFSRLAAKRKLVSEFQEEITQEDVDEYEEYSNQEDLIHSIQQSIGLKHPIIFDVYDLCEYSANGTLAKLSVKLLKEILSHFEVGFKSTERKPQLIERLKEMVNSCSCGM